MQLITLLSWVQELRNTAHVVMLTYVPITAYKVISTWKNTMYTHDVLSQSIKSQTCKVMWKC